MLLLFEHYDFEHYQTVPFLDQVDLYHAIEGLRNNFQSTALLLAKLLDTEDSHWMRIKKVDNALAQFGSGWKTHILKLDALKGPKSDNIPPFDSLPPFGVHSQ